MNHQHPKLIHQKYRPDIDGLRAVAIISVLTFHAFPSIMPGGFIGVDIFFVISGFLISTITFSSLERNRFSLLEFYSRRILRIFPALILTLVFCATFGWLILFSNEYKQLGKHIAAGSGFIQNFILLGESGYFDNLAETKPLLHLWSLAIEEQFYIFWPLLLMHVWRRQWNFLSITTIVATISLGANIYLTNSNPSASFYLPISRFWELMIGGILAYISLHRPQLIEGNKNFQSFLGFSLIFLGLFFINKGREFPGWWALLPTLGAFFFISAGPNTWLNQNFLANKVMVWVGLISYPLYLWHWPLLAFLSILEGASSRSGRLGAIVVAFALAWMTYVFIEKPLRFGGKSRAKIVTLILSASMLFLFGILCFKTNGLEQFGDGRSEYVAYFDISVPEMKYFREAKIFQKFRAECDFYDLDKYRAGKATKIPRPSIEESCYKRDVESTHAVVIWGDSHAQMLYYGVKRNIPDDWQVLMASSSGCAPDPTVSAPSTTQYCQQSNWFALQTITNAKPDVVIVGQNLGHSLEQMARIASKLRTMGVKKILFTGPSPHWRIDLPKFLARKLWNNTPKRTYDNVDPTVIELNEKLKAGFRQQDDEKFISLIDFFCDSEGCMTYLESDKKLGITSWDYGHLTPIASDLLGKNFLTNEIVN